MFYHSFDSFLQNISIYMRIIRGMKCIAIVLNTAPGNVSKVFVKIIVKRELEENGTTASNEVIKLNTLPNSSSCIILDEYERIPTGAKPPEMENYELLFMVYFVIGFVFIYLKFI